MSSGDSTDGEAALFSKDSIPDYRAATSSTAPADSAADSSSQPGSTGTTTPPGASAGPPNGGSAPGSGSAAAAGEVPLAAAGCICDGDVLALLDRLEVVGTHDGPDAQDGVLAAELAALESADSDDGGRVASPAWIGQCLPAGPGLAAMLACEPPEEASDWDLPGLAAGYRRVAAWAQARELAAAAEIAARCAAANPKISTRGSGQPDHVPPEAAAQLALELRMSQLAACDWMSLGSQLRWRLPATGTALAAGRLDVPRARVIAEGTAALDGELAAEVEQAIVAAAPEQTTGQLRAAVRRAVLSADPEGAEERRRAAERRARLTLYPEPDGTASLNGTSLPGIHAAAAMARITAMARALKASGAHGGLDLLRARIYLGLLLGTLPLIPPPPGAPPDQPPPPDNGPGPEPPPDDSTGQPADQSPADGSGTDPAEQDTSPAEEDTSPAQGSGSERVPSGGSGLSLDQPPSSDRNTNPTKEDADPIPPGCEDLPGPWTDIPCPGDTQAPRPEDDPPLPPEPPPRARSRHDEDDEDDGWPAPDWSPLPALVPAPPATGRTKVSAARPPAGLLDFTVPWTALAGPAGRPGQLSRAGWLTSFQTRQLLVAAALSPMTRWHVVVTDPDGRALDSQRLPPWRPGQHPGRDAVIGRVTVAIPLTALPPDSQPPPGTGTGTGRPLEDRRADLRLPPDTPPILQTIAGPLLHAARAAAARYRQTDAAAAGGCAHTLATAAYRPPPRLRDAVAIRDRTCRFTPCGQPAWRTDLDHTLAWHNGGRTCTCGLGGCCRTHHRIKQLPGWNLEQITPGTFRWTTPAGRTYITRPDPYPI